MKRGAWKVGTTGLALLGAVACSVPKEAEFPEVDKHVQRRTGHTIFWNQGGEHDARVAKAVRVMLAHELTAAEVVQIALLNNRRLQATYEELAVSQADVVQAGLLSNPVFAADMHFPVDGAGTVAHFGVEQDFLSLLLLPARKRLARAAFEATKLRVAHAVVDFAFEVRSAYFELQGALQVLGMRRLILEAAEASLELATRQHEAGNISDLDLENQASLFDEVRIDLARSEAGISTLREKLTRMMGLWGADTAWRIGGKLPELPREDPPPEHVESVAMAQRLDVAAARQDMQVRSHALTMAKNWRWLGGASVGADVAHEPFGTYVGPTGSLELPLFDQKQALVARLEAELRQSQARLHAVSVEVRSEVRDARARVLFTRNLVEHYVKVVIPRRERLVALTQTEYDAMLVGVYQLLDAKRAETDAYRETIDAVRDYWIARAELDRSAGGRLAPAVAPAGSPPPTRKP